MDSNTTVPHTSLYILCINNVIYYFYHELLLCRDFYHILDYVIAHTFIIISIYNVENIYICKSVPYENVELFTFVIKIVFYLMGSD